MRPFLDSAVGNASAPHGLGAEARASLDAARTKLARLIGGTAAGVVFTSGATEANNLAVRGVVERAAGRHVVVSSIEHVSVVNCCRDLLKRGVAVSWVPVDADGRLDPRAVGDAIHGDTALVSITAASGEIGTLEPVREIGRITRARGVPFHVDGVQAVGRIPLHVEDWSIDLLTVSSNDLYGPPGAGALWVRPEVGLAPIILGGGQERGYRSGTENLPGIVGMGVAADLARAESGGEASRLAALRDRLLAGLLDRVRGARRTGARPGSRLPHHASLVVPGVKAEAVLLELDARGLSASTGSACASLTGEPSHVLRAIGCDREAAEGSLCFTLGRWTAPADVDVALDLVPSVVERLRRLGPRASA
jgi:cysteine desulfurase